MDPLARYRPFLRYDSQESFSADSPALLTDAFRPNRTNSLKRADGSVLATADAAAGPAPLSLDFLDGAQYVTGAAVKSDDFLDAAGRDYVGDARAMHAKDGYGDRICAHEATDGAGKRWLQYWFFYYYNDKSFLGLGLHEGDWEMIQIGLDDRHQPDVVTLAQHNAGERCAWADVETKDGAPVIYVARGSHASHIHKGKYAAPVVPDYNDGRGRLVQPELILIDDNFPSWSAWPGFWGSSRARSAVESNSPRGPSKHPVWTDPAAFHAHAAPTHTVNARAQAVRAVPGPPQPSIAVHRDDDHAQLQYTFPAPQPGTLQPAKLVASIDSPDDELPPYSDTIEVTAPDGTYRFAPVLGPGFYEVSVSAYDADGHGSAPVHATVPSTP
jgi:hypothetical protein